MGRIINSGIRGVAYGDAEKACRLAATVGIRLATDFSTLASGGHVPRYRNEVSRKYASSLFRD